MQEALDLSDRESLDQLLNIKHRRIGNNPQVSAYFSHLLFGNKNAPIQVLHPLNKPHFDCCFSCVHTRTHQRKDYRLRYRTSQNKHKGTANHLPYPNRLIVAVSVPILLDYVYQNQYTICTSLRFSYHRSLQRALSEEIPSVF